MKKWTILSLLVVFVLGLAPVALAENVKMAGSDWPVWEHAHGMDEQGKLENIDFSYEKYATCIDGFVKGKIDVTFMTIYDFIATQRENPNGVIIAVQDYSNGGDGIIIREDIVSAADLKDTKIGLPTEAIFAVRTKLIPQKKQLVFERC